MIPKIIHYCWFGGNSKPSLATKCMKSWQKYCPDYEIIEWNEKSFDLSAAPLYVRQAYDNKKWAFVTDYVRLWAMYNYGGIYMDTDVEVLRSLDDLLKKQAFSGFEAVDRIPTGIMASEKDFPLFREFIRDYESALFEKEDGSFDLTTNVARITNICKKYGFIPNGKYQEVEGFALYPQDFFCPKYGYGGKIKTTKNTYTIHHFMGSWASKQDKKKWKENNSGSIFVKIKWDLLKWGSDIGKSVIGEEYWRKIRGK